MKFGQSRRLLTIFGVLALVISLISVLVYIATSNFIRQDYFKTIKIRTGILIKLDNDMHREESDALSQVLTGLSEKTGK
ncbi:MAG: hypothetical protein KL787_00955 [Taibaiella sp.]|nr:hypothetical protein [Taibaiella sp.]